MNSTRRSGLAEVSSVWATEKGYRAADCTVGSCILPSFTHVLCMKGNTAVRFFDSADCFLVTRLLDFPGLQAVPCLFQPMLGPEEDGPAKYLLDMATYVAIMATA